MMPATTKSGRVYYVRPALRNRPILVMNGFNYRPARREPCPSAWQALCAGLAIAAFVVGGVLAMGGMI